MKAFTKYGRMISGIRIVTAQVQVGVRELKGYFVTAAAVPF